MECPAGTWIGAPLARSSTGVPDCTAATSGAAGGVICTTTVVNPDAATTGSPFSVTNDEPNDVVSSFLGAVLYPLRPNTCLACPSNHYSPYPRASAASHYNAACRCAHHVRMRPAAAPCTAAQRALAHAHGTPAAQLRVGALWTLVWDYSREKRARTGQALGF